MTPDHMHDNDHDREVAEELAAAVYEPQPDYSEAENDDA